MESNLKDNTIYYLQVEEKPGLAKIGETSRDVKQRNIETTLNASLHIIGDVQAWTAKKKDGTYFRDKDLHKFLEDKGYERELNDNNNKSEWFYDLSLDKFKELFEEFIAEKPKKVYLLREGQQKIKNETLQAINDGYKLINVNACVRVGKTIYSLDLAKTLDCFPVYIGKNLTSQISADKDNDEYNIVESLARISLHGKSEDKVEKIIPAINALNTENKDIIFFVDEVDDASHREKSRTPIKEIIDHYRSLKQFKCLITMTGTRAYRGIKVLKHIALEDEKIAEVNISYFEMQQIQPDSTVSRNYRGITIYVNDPEAELSTISSAMKTSDGRDSIAQTLVSLMENNTYGIKYNNAFPHTFVKISTVGKDHANQLVRLMNDKYSTIDGNDYIYVNINGDTTTAREAQDFCQTHIRKNPDKKIMFITQGMATTSFSVQTIGNTIVLSDNELTADDIQALHRSCTHADGKTHANLTFITTNASEELKLDDIFEDDCRDVLDDRDAYVKRQKEMLPYNSITYYMVDNSTKGVTQFVVSEREAEQYIDKKSIHMTTVSSVLQTLEGEELTELYEMYGKGKTSKVKSTSKKSVTKTGKVSAHPFGLPEKNTNGKKNINELSKEQKEKITRIFVDASILMVATLGASGVEIQDGELYDSFSLDKELFLMMYNDFNALSDRLDMVHNLSKNDDYYIHTYLDRVSTIA